MEWRAAKSRPSPFFPHRTVERARSLREGSPDIDDISRLMLKFADPTTDDSSAVG
jgi:hypothetical protein